MKYAIALGGGGAKGAYQIGVWKALKEMNIEIQTVLGTSVGAINAAAISLGKYEEAKALWEQLDYSKIMVFEKHMIQEKKSVNLFDFLKEFFQNKGIDVSPLKNMLCEFINEKELRSTPIEFGIVTASLSDFKPYVMFESEIPEGQIVDYILASASLPIFKKMEIEGKIFIDGAVYDNVPVMELIERGHKNIIGIDISGMGMQRKFDEKEANVIYIKNSESLGGILEFSGKNVKRNILMGYLDARKAFNHYVGSHYYIIKDESIQKNAVTEEELNLIFKPMSSSVENTTRNQIIRTLRKYTDGKIDGENVLVASIEIAAEVFSIERLREYTVTELSEEILKQYSRIKKTGHNPIKSLSRNLKKARSASSSKKAIKNLFTPYIINEKELPSMLMLVALPKLYIANLLIYILLWRKKRNRRLQRLHKG
ncbi:MAG: patatin-like phospholipase family protein [Clostridia bacterium]|nr:patatin-like phospholipase family protein [Clostridia bacterium]